MDLTLQKNSSDKIIKNYENHMIYIDKNQYDYNIFVSKDLIAKLHTKNIGIEFMSTEAACKTFNILLQEDRNVIAGLVV